MAEFVTRLSLVPAEGRVDRLRRAVVAFRERGMTWMRVTEHVEARMLTLEGWRERPDDEGAPPDPAHA
jgi:hypothetical protein